MDYLDAWAWQPDKCNCDGEFIEWFKYNQFEYKSIFHMGSGMHHKVGLELGDYNSVLSITLSEVEYREYQRLLTIGSFITYVVIFDDINNIEGAFLDKFDIITLFHFGEYNEPFADLKRTLGMFIDSLEDNGYILAYANSAAKDIAIPLFDEALQLVDTYKSLRIYQKKEKNADTISNS